MNENKIVRGQVIESRVRVSNAADAERVYDIEGELTEGQGGFVRVTSGTVKRDGEYVGSFNVDGAYANVSVTGAELMEVVVAVNEFVNDLKAESDED